MPSERVLQQIERFLDEADAAVAGDDWELVRKLTQRVLTLDPENADALPLLAAAERGLQQSPRVATGSARPAVGDTRTSGSQSELGTVASPAPHGNTPESFVGGRYVVRKFLGEGGKKRVYLAHDTLLDRDIAFALIKTDGLDDTGRDRIKREAQAMGRLGAHPHVVSVFDLGELSFEDSGAERTPYIVTELMGGGDLQDLIETAPGHRPPLAQTLQLGIEVCRGLEFAHAHGIVHRDLKPGNVWLTALTPNASPNPGRGEAATSPHRSLGEGQGEGVAKLGDFGLAVALDRSRLTQAGMMVGTVAYMPPEQALGGAVTPLADLYSLGAMLYEMVAGRPPFIGDESVAIITQHLNAAPVMPSWHNPSVPAALETLILRLLEKDPAMRPTGATEVRELLEGILRQAQDERAGAMSRSPTPDGERSRGTPSPAGEGQGEGESQAVAGAQALAGNPMYRRAFAGREPELRQLQQAFDAATSGQGSLVMVVGEPGIGKTSLCEQLATYAAIRGGKTLVGRCYEEGSLSLPYLPFVEAMRGYVLTHDTEALRQELGNGAADVARIVSEIRDRLPRGAGPHPGPLPILGEWDIGGVGRSADPEEERYRLLQAVASFLRNASSVQPLVIVLEDLHDADRGTLDLLLHLSRNLGAARLLLLGTYRDIEVDRAHALSATLAELRRGQNFARVLLRGLTADEVQRMMASVSQQEIPWPLAELVHRQTEGNPLFVQEVLRYLVEERLVERRDGALRRVGEESLAGRIPEGLRDVIGKRLSRLSSDCNRLLSMAAVIGREFSLEALRAIAGVEEEPLVQALEEAVRIGVLEDRSQRGLVRFRFGHAFFRQTLYEELFTPRRLRLHQEVARVLERQYAGRLQEHAAELADHFAESGDPADLAKAVQYGELAAQRAMSVYAYGEAARHLEQALQAQDVLDPGDRERRCDLLLALAGAILPGGAPLRVPDEIAPAALDLAVALGDQVRASQACHQALEGLRRYGTAAVVNRPEYRRWAANADRHAAPGTADRVWADVGMSRDLYFADHDEGEAWALSQRALALARSLGNPELLFQVAAHIIELDWLPEHLDEQRRIVEEFAGQRPEGVSASTLGLVASRAGHVLLMWGERARAEELWRQAGELSAFTQDSYLALGPTMVEAALAILDGRLEAAIVATDRLGTRAEELGVSGFGGLMSRFMGMYPRFCLGLAEVSLAALSQSAALWSGGAYTSVGTTIFALHLAHLGRVSEAESALEQLAARQEIGPQLTWNTRGLPLLLEAAVLAGSRDLCRLISVHLASAHGTFVQQTLGNTSRQLGGAAALLGEREKALAYYQESLAAATKIRFRPEVALTHLEIAELLLEQPTDLTPGPFPAREGETTRSEAGGRFRAEALEHLDFAIAELREMKMRPALERALRHKEVLRA